MEIDLSLLHSSTVKEVDITNIYSIPKEYFGTTGVLELNNIKVEGIVYRKLEEEENNYQDYIKCKIAGRMMIEDSISLEPVEYPFSIEYHDILEENCKKNENTLDIFQFLWENIVLEIPLRFTKVKDLSKFQGNGWKLVSEEEPTQTNNPFAELLKDYKEEG